MLGIIVDFNIIIICACTALAIIGITIYLIKILYRLVKNIEEEMIQEQIDKHKIGD